jgi:hypothetical protein
MNIRCEDPVPFNPGDEISSHLLEVVRPKGLFKIDFYAHPIDDFVATNVQPSPKTAAVAEKPIEQ